MSAVFPVADDPRWRQHDASAGQTTFPIPYVFQDAADITVERISADGAVTTLAYPTDYAISGAGNPAGGNYTLVTPAQAGEKYRSIGTAVGARTSSIVRSGRYSSAATDDDLDRALIRDLEQRRDIDRGLKVPLGASAGVELQPEPNQFIGWNFDGTGIENKGTPGKLGAGDMLETVYDPTGKGRDVFDAANHSADYSLGLAADPLRLSTPEYIGRDIIDLDSWRRLDTGDFWPLLKALLENDTSIRADLMNGARLKLRGGRAWRFLSRANGYITLPQRLVIEGAPSSFIDASELPTSTAPIFFTYSGWYGNPTRPVTADYLAGTTIIPLQGGQVAALGLKKGDRLIIRATEGLDSLAVGAWTREGDVDVSQPSSFTFWAANTDYAAGAGVIATGLAGTANGDWNGYCLRCIASHNSGTTFDRTKWTPTSINAISEDVHIESIAGDTLRLTRKLRYNYPEEARPVVCKFEGAGEHHLTNINVVGNFPNALDRGAWATGGSYAVGEMAYVASASGGNNRYYLVLADHIAGTFAADLAAGKWKDLGSDRAFKFRNTGKVTLEGGGFERLSGPAFASIGVESLVVRDHNGIATSQRNSPGGYFYIGGCYSKGLIENSSVKGAAQPFMLSSTGSDYGVGYGLAHRSCRAAGGASGFTQHNMFDNTIYDDCEHEGNIPGTVGGSSFDIRTSSRLLNCRSRSHSGRAIVLRSQFMGRGVGDCTDRGTVISKFDADHVLTGVEIEDVAYVDAYPVKSGYLEISDGKWTNVGGVGTKGALYLVYSQSVGGVRPTLGKSKVTGNRTTMASTGHCFQMAGKWEASEWSDNFADGVDGYAFTGWRGYRFHDASGGAGNGPNHLIFDASNKQSGVFIDPQFLNCLEPHIGGWQVNGSEFAPGERLYGTFTYDVPSIGGTFGGNFQSTTITDARVAAGDRVTVWGQQTSGVQMVALAGAGQFTVWWLNFTTAAIDMSSRSWSYEIMKNRTT